MKIIDSKQFLYYDVVTDEENHNVYRRIDKDIWEQLFGESWESVTDSKELEKAFHDYYWQSSIKVNKPKYTANELLIEATRNSPTASEMVNSQILSDEDVGKIYKAVAQDWRIPVRFLMNNEEEEKK